VKHSKRIFFYLIEALLGACIFVGLYYTYTHFLDKTASCKDDYCLWDGALVTQLDDSHGGKFAFLNLKEARPERLRVLIVGDSVVYNGCPDVLAIEKELNMLAPFTFRDRKISEFNVINAGKGGSDIAYSLERVDALRRAGHRFDMIFFLTGWNEHWYETSPCLRAGCYRDKSLYRWLYNASSSEDKVVNRLAKETIGAMQERDLQYCEELFYVNPEVFLSGYDHLNTSIYRISLPEYNSYLTKIRDIASEDNSILALVTVPDGLIEGEVPYISTKDCTLIDPEYYYPVHQRYVDALRNFSVDNGIPLLDLQEEFRKNPDYRQAYFWNASFDPIHPSSVGVLVANNAYIIAIKGILGI
jgi:hypothetical protein